MTDKCFVVCSSVRSHPALPSPSDVARLSPVLMYLFAGWRHCKSLGDQGHHILYADWPPSLVMQTPDISTHASADFQHPTNLNTIGVYENLADEHVTVCHCFAAGGNAKKLAQALDIATLSLTADDEEKRYDGDALYTKQEFQDFYGKDWEVEWNAAPVGDGGKGFKTAASSDDFGFDDFTPAERAAARGATLTANATMMKKGPSRSPSIGGKPKLSIAEREALYDSPFAKSGSLVDTFDKVMFFGQVCFRFSFGHLFHNYTSFPQATPTHIPRFTQMPAENNLGGPKIMQAARQQFVKQGVKPKQATVEIFENNLKVTFAKGKEQEQEYLIKDIGYTYEFQGENLSIIVVDDSVRQHVVYLMFGIQGGAKGGAAGLVRSLNTRKKMKNRGASGDSRISNEPMYDSIQAFEATYYGLASFSQMNNHDEAAVRCFKAIARRTKHAEGVFVIVTKKGLRCVGALNNQVLHSWSPEAISYFSSYKDQLVVMHRDENTGVVDVMLLSTTTDTRASLIKQVFQNTWFPPRGPKTKRPSKAGSPDGKSAPPLNPDDVSQDFVAQGPRTPAPESLFKRQIHRRDLTPEKVLGAGQFGKVYRAHMKAYKNFPEGTVAVKVLKDVKSNTDRNEFIHEAEVMLETDHPNLVNMLGVAVQQRPWLMALDLCAYGDLQKLLKVAKMKQVDLTETELVHVCSEVSKGMAYMEKINFVHCDLAARNVLVGAENQFKVADFGMTRRLRNRPRWRGQQGLKVAIRWSSIEVLDDRIYTTKADVWAFGVVMWEIFAYGMMPYPGLKNAEVHRLLRNGGVMKAPPGTPKQIYDMMKTTWRTEATSRPTFKDIVGELGA